MAKTLAEFSIVRRGEDYILTLEDDNGDKTVLTADFEQLDSISEAIDEQLNSVDDDDVADDGDDEVAQDDD